MERPTLILAIASNANDLKLKCNQCGRSSPSHICPALFLLAIHRRPARVLTSTQTASTKMLPFTIICQ